MIKAIFFDIDGTLISKQKPLVQENVIQGLQQLRNQGIQLFIASGRHMLELEELKINQQFEFDGYLLLNGGYCLVHDQVIYDQKIDAQDVQEIVKVVYLLKIIVCISIMSIKESKMLKHPFLQ